jgi:hypothetical protein
VPVAGSEPVGPSSAAGGASLVVEVLAGLRRFGRRHRALITVLGSLAAAAVLVLLLAGRRDEFGAALSEAAAWVLVVTALLQIVALVARNEAWHLAIEAAGETVDRRVLYRASSMQVLGGVIIGQLGVAARIAALRRSSPDVSSHVPTPFDAIAVLIAVVTLGQLQSVPASARRRRCSSSAATASPILGPASAVPARMARRSPIFCSRASGSGEAGRTGSRSGCGGRCARARCSRRRRVR